MFLLPTLQQGVLSGLRCFANYVDVCSSPLLAPRAQTLFGDVMLDLGYRMAWASKHPEFTQKNAFFHSFPTCTVDCLPPQQGLASSSSHPVEEIIGTWSSPPHNVPSKGQWGPCSFNSTERHQGPPPLRPSFTGVMRSSVMFLYLVWLVISRRPPILLAPRVSALSSGPCRCS